MSRLRVVKGWFEETLPVAVEEVGEIAILHIDADWYDSVKIALDVFYGQIVPGGFVAVDDLKTWRGAADATTYFRQEQGITAPIRSAPLLENVAAFRLCADVYGRLH